jgi:hypothetical protein
MLLTLNPNIANLKRNVRKSYKNFRNTVQLQCLCYGHGGTLGESRDSLLYVYELLDGLFIRVWPGNVGNLKVNREWDQAPRCLPRTDGNLFC